MPVTYDFNMPVYYFINTCSVKKNDLKHFLLWWHERRSHVFEPFRINHAPSTNLSESWYSSWSNTGMNNLSLLDAAYMDAVESAITEAEINNFIDGSFSGGSGQNQETQNQRQQEKTQSKAHTFAYEFKLFKSSGDFGWANYSADVHFGVDPNSSHRPDKRRQEPAKRYQDNAKKKCSNDIRPERTWTNQSKEFPESLTKALNEPFILEKTDGDLIRISIGYSFKVYSINSQTTYSVIINQNPR